jgi:peptide deformylase
MGRLIQHEIDHLDGVLLIDRLEPDARKEAMRELRRYDFGGPAAADDGVRRL